MSTESTGVVQSMAMLWGIGGGDRDSPADHQDIGQCVQHGKACGKQKEEGGLRMTGTLTQGPCM